MSRYKGKLAIVTGSAVGIGAGIVERLLKGGLKVLGWDIRDKHKISNSNYIPIKVDMSKEDEIRCAFKNSLDQHGPVNVLINNAGVLENTNLSCGDIMKWQKTVDINIMGLTVATKEAIKQMNDNKIDGHIVQFASILGHFIPKVPFNIYTASKHAVVALAESLRLELADANSKIKICTMCPGVVETEIFTVNDFVRGKGLQEKVDDAVKLQPEHIADGIWFMIDQPPNVNVATIIIRPTRELL